MILTHTVTAQEAGLTLQQLLRGPMALSGRQTRNAKAQGAVDCIPLNRRKNKSVS